MVYEDYLLCTDYENRDAHAEAGFSAFFHEESSRHFFSLLDADGKVILKSEGYPQAAAREMVFNRL
ncbi:MAG: YegP family protein [Saprospiraceae bacterium]|nr:YegP family protein [Saprospiraceae bacterium]